MRRLNYAAKLCGIWQNLGGGMYSLGIDIGSTTAKFALMDGERLVFSAYERHFSQVRQKACELLERLKENLKDERFTLAISGSAGFGICKATKIDFAQEVFATAEAVKRLEPQASAVIELGGEDAKILFLKGGLEERMNGTCAGGTGAFIDQMITLLGISAEEFDALALSHKKIYPVASRCGVFAKSDVQPLLNQGIAHSDISASIFQAVVDQTIAGLAQGRKIEGRVLFLGGPLFYYKGLQERFKVSLKLGEENAVFPEWARFSVAMGAAIYSQNLTTDYSCSELISILQTAKNAAISDQQKRLPPLFSSKNELKEFRTRHAKADVPRLDENTFSGEVYLGIDCGSTTTKMILIDEKGAILWQFYASNEGNPVAVILRELRGVYEKFGKRIKIRASAVTGYGEELIKAAFCTDLGLVETMAHLKAAEHFEPNVDFVIDIGGQDMKCFYIKNGAVDNILLNEACSSGCGSFIETFAKGVGYNAAEFATLGLESAAPVELGSRCTVFMNSSVKEAQKEGANINDISAGLSMSVVKNAIYKVIRAHSADDLGVKIVCQGGTFLNDAILRAFEREIKREVIRPAIAGLMGAFGAALYAKEWAQNRANSLSSILNLEQLQNFKHKSNPSQCHICGNKCQMTINIFDDASGKSRRMLSGNRCDKPLGKAKSNSGFLPNLYEYKLNKIRALMEQKPHEQSDSVILDSIKETIEEAVQENIKEKFKNSRFKIFKWSTKEREPIGIPLGLNMIENAPFWHAFFNELGFSVIFSEISSRKTYTQGQATIPSDTVCYPAKLMHGHIENLLSRGLKTIFYPCAAYAFADTNVPEVAKYNCPVVAFYPEVLGKNIDSLRGVRFLAPYFGLHRADDFVNKAASFFKKEFGISKSELKKATNAAFAAREKWRDEIVKEGERALKYAVQNNLKCVVLSGRPYHIDPEINHGIDKMLNSLGVVVLSEDALPFADNSDFSDLKVLNQWSYHSRLYNAARRLGSLPNCELVQLVSFGCGIDSITTDEVRDILEASGKFYTQIKIDEISNLGAAKIRVRSLLAAMDLKNAEMAKNAKKLENCENSKSAFFVDSMKSDLIESVRHEIPAFTRMT